MRDVSHFTHVRNRAFLRYGILPTRAHIEDIEARIQGGAGRMLYTQPGGREVWMIEALQQDEPIPLVYDPQRRRVITFLPRHSYQSEAFA